MSAETDKRPYRMTKRAALEEQTRLRITESAVALHEELGPARTSISAIADHAGVRRSTVYRHFPDDEALLDACSAHWEAAHPPPDPTPWQAIADPDARLELALTEIYAYFDRTEGMFTSLLRDAELVPGVDLRLGGFRGYLAAVQDVLVAGRGVRGGAARRVRAAVAHALAFPTWRSLTRDQGLSNADAVALMTALVGGAARAG